MTAADRRELTRAIQRLGPDVDALALTWLCRLAKCTPPKRVARVPANCIAKADAKRCRYPAPTPPRPLSRVRPQPKSRKRIVDPKAIAQYRRTHPWCEALAYNHQPGRDVHHIRKRSQGGDDVEANFLMLCRYHHDEWHQHGPRRWYVRHANWLSDETREKVLAVYWEKWGMGSPVNA